MSKVPPSQTPAATKARVAKSRAAAKERGLVKLEVWTKPEHREAIKACAVEINQQPNSVMQKI